jgi:hypothetical protein
MAEAEHHVLTRDGDGCAEVDEALRRLESGGTSREAAGFIKCLYVTRAGQTVVMVRDRACPLAAGLRARPGWREPGDAPLA